MEKFFLTSEIAPEGVGFSGFSFWHIVWLVGFIACLFLCGMLYRKADNMAAAKWRKTIAVLIVANEVVLKQLPLILLGNWLPNYLPLHLCSINVFLIAWHAWKGGDLLGDFLYTVCIPGAVAALLFPSWTALPPFCLMSIHSFTIHILLVLYPVLLLIRGDVKPTWRRIPQCLLILIGLAVIALVANWIFDTNFFFLSKADPGNPLYLFETMWGSHLLGFPVLITAVLIVMHVPLVLVKKFRKDK